MTKEKIKSEIFNELSDALDKYFEGIKYLKISKNNIVSIDIEKKEIFVKFNFNIMEEKNYAGLLLENIFYE